MLRPYLYPKSSRGDESHASTFRIKSGVSKDGRIVARDCEVWWNGGAYADIGPRVTQKSGFTAPGPYDVQDVSIDSYELYTNLPPAGALLRTSVMATHDRETLDRALGAFASVKAAFEAEHGPLPAPVA